MHICIYVYRITGNIEYLAVCRILGYWRFFFWRMASPGYNYIHSHSYCVTQYKTSTCETTFEMEFSIDSCIPCFSLEVPIHCHDYLSHTDAQCWDYVTLLCRNPNDLHGCYYFGKYYVGGRRLNCQTAKIK